MVPDTAESRKHSRHNLSNTLIVDHQGTCRVFNLSSGGVSFGCTGYSAIPDRLVVDIVDDNGLHLLDLPIDRVWDAKNRDVGTSAIYETIVGAKFSDDLSPGQQSALNQLLEFFKEVNLQ